MTHKSYDLTWNFTDSRPQDDIAIQTSGIHHLKKSSFRTKCNIESSRNPSKCSDLIILLYSVNVKIQIYHVSNLNYRTVPIFSQQNILL